MNLITLHNPTESNIVDYKIEEIEFDQNGQVMLDKDNNAKKTGRTLEWSLKAGETLKFPDYVANYLMGIYGFLEKVTEEQSKPIETVSADGSVHPSSSESMPKNVAQPEEGGIICKFCGKTSRGIKGIALHLAHAHPEELKKGFGIR